MLDVLNQFGEFTDQTATRKACHQEGLWHRGVVVNIVKPDKSQILLQKRSQTKKLWPGLWDMAIGGHVAAGEFSYQAALREAEEEIGLKFTLKIYFSLARPFRKIRCLALLIVTSMISLCSMQNLMPAN